MIVFLAGVCNVEQKGHLSMLKDGSLGDLRMPKKILKNNPTFLAGPNE